MKKLFAIAAALLGIISLHADTTLVFNEIMYHPPIAGTNEAQHEWLELYNQLAVDLDVSGWRIKGDVDFLFPTNTRIPGRSFIVIAANPAQLLADNPSARNIIGQFTNRLSNSGGTLRLYNNADRLMDEVSYGTEGDWPVAPDGSGVTLAKRDRDFGSSKAANWTFSDQVSGTPGYDNFALIANAGLIAVDGSWKFNDSGTDLGTAWQARTYDDSSWASRHNLTNRSVPTLFNTGIDTNGAVMANGTPNPNYKLTAAAQGQVGAQATNMLNHPNWLANSSSSTWIGVVPDGSASVAAGAYNYETTFSLAGFIPSTVQVNLSVAVDNQMTNVFLNGVPQNFYVAGFASMTPAGAISSGFTSGTNTLEFRTLNDGASANPHGLRVQYTSSGLSVNTNSPLAPSRSTYYFRKAFLFNGDPNYATLTLNTIAADGAVYYLNGVEVYRQNMPAGPVSYATPALSDVSSLGYSGAITIGASNLVSGTNVLAVEVHQAIASNDGPVMGVDLRFSELSKPRTQLIFTEVTGSTNSPFWIEIMNVGGAPVNLDDILITHDASGTNDVFVKPNIPLAPGQRLAITNTMFGVPFASGDKLFLEDNSTVIDAVVVKRGPRARLPDAGGEWLFPTTLTPGAANNVVLRNEIVINEIMYNPIRDTNSPLLEFAGQQFIEFYNRGTGVVDLTGWSIDGAVRYDFPVGKTIAPGQYLVVWENASVLRDNGHPNDTIKGFAGHLSGKDERITLKDSLGNPANSVHYYSDGRWPEYADGGGSSLELRDPYADNSQAEAWAASDQTGQTGWQTNSYTFVATASATSSPDTQWREFVLGLLSGGECLIDDISVVQNPGGANIQFVTNGDFESSITGWRPLGNHRNSSVEAEPGNPANHVLHLYATGPQEHMHNHIETTLANGRSITNGYFYQISYRAKWLAGANLLNTRLYFNRGARTFALPRSNSGGTPGAQNSRFAGNIGPTFSSFAHAPITPSAAQAVTVTVQAQDPQSVTNCQMWWSANGGAWSSTNMTVSGGTYSGGIPGMSAGTLVQFYVRATDGLGAVSTFPAAGSNSAAFYRVDDGLANVAVQHNMRILMSPANTALMHATTNVMSNELLPCTVIYDERVAYYNVGVRLKSSERGRAVATRVGFHLEFPPDQLFRGVHSVLLVDRSGGGSRPAQEEILLKHMAQRAGLHIPNSDVMKILAPQSAQNGAAIVAPRFEDEFLDASFNSGSDGTLWELELIYYPLYTNAFGYKLPYIDPSQPDGVQGLDVQDNGNEKETYRYNFIIKNHRGADNYAPFIQLSKIWSNTNLNLLDQQTHMVMDINEWMRTYALISLCGVGDMYTFGNHHNFMFYRRPSDGQFLYFPWDMDFSFNNGATSALVGNSPANNLNRIINLTPNLRLLYAHMLDQIATVYNTTYMSPWLSHYGPFSGQDYSGDAGYIQQRGDFAKTTINGAGGNSAFAVNGTNFITASNNLIVLSGTAPVSVQSILVNSNEYPITWTSLSTWTMTIPVSAASNNLNIVGYDLHGNVVSNATRTVVYTNAIPNPVGNVMFSEIMYNPAAPGASFVELFNASSNFVFDLSGWRINGLDFTFPNGTVLSNRQFITVCENEPAFLAAYGSAGGRPAATFDGALQLDGETLTLIKPGSTPAQDIVVDKVRYDGAAPWPVAGSGASVGLVDNAQDNVRVANWMSSFSPTKTNDGWRFVAFTNTFGTQPRIIMYPDTNGLVLLDDLSLVTNNVPQVGKNYIVQGDFETPFGTNWVFGTNMQVFETSSIAHAGANSGYFYWTNGGSSSILTKDLVHHIEPPLPPSGQVCVFSFWYYATSSTPLNLTARILGTSINFVTNLQVFVIPATNYVTPGAANFGATALPQFPTLWINELQADNVTGVTDNFGEREPWLEIFNSGSNAMPLDGLYLSMNYDGLLSFALPSGITIPPGQFKVIWCDGQTNQTSGTNIHTNFRLASGTGSIALSRVNNGQPQVLDYVNYKNIHGNRSYGSFPDGQPFDRQEFFYVTPGGTNNGTSAPISVFINEWMASNTGFLADPADNDNDDWFEIYNPGTNAVDLAGYYLTDSLTNAAGVVTNKFQFKITTNMAHVIPPGGYLLVWADNETGQNQTGGTNRTDMHANFQLAKAGEAVGIFAADGTAIDYVVFGAQTNDVSQGRFADGSASIYYMTNPTPRAANSLGGAANTPPVLAAIGNKAVYLGNTLSFTASATDSDVPAQTLAFSLDPGAPAGATISGAGGFSWTPTATGSFSFNVRVTDGGMPPLSDFESITVDVLSAPQFTSSVRNGSNLELTWNTRAGQQYRVEYKDDLNDAQWQLLQVLTATGDSLSATNSTLNAPKRFFRIHIQ